MSKAYITKYALTSGIQEMEGRVSDHMFVSSSKFMGCFHGKDWHSNMEEAIERAEEMRIKKLQSLDKQVKRISALKFD